MLRESVLLLVLLPVETMKNKHLTYYEESTTHPETKALNLFFDDSLAGSKTVGESSITIIGVVSGREVL